MTWLSASASSSRRRVMVFSLAFFPAVTASLIYVYTQPPEYRAVARLQISPAAVVTQATDAKDAPAVVTNSKSFLTEVQILTSRPLLQDVVGLLKNSGTFPDMGPDPVAATQQMLHAEPIEGTQIVQLSATGPQQQFGPRLVNTVVDAYRRHVDNAYKGLATNTYGDVSDELRTLDGKVAAKRDAVNAFRKRYDIVSMEHKENDVLADIEGLSESYSAANERLAKAQGRLETLKNGKAVIHAKDDPTLADLQQRVSVLREQWHEMQGRFTPAYLSLDADATALRARLANLEEQLKSQVTSSERTAFAEAQEELASAQAAVDRLRKNVADNQKQAQKFATHLNEYKTMREDLDHLEGMHRAALDQLAKLQASERERAPRVQLLEAAAPSQQPWRPDYRLEAALGVGGALVFGLFATWFVDFITGPAAHVPTFMQYSWSSALLGPDAAMPSRLSATSDIARLPAPEPPARELTDAEIAALVAAATEDARLIAVALLIGVSAEEIVALRWDDIDFAADVIRIGGEAVRLMPLDDPVCSLLAARRQRQSDASGTILRGPDGNLLKIEEVARLVLFAAYDAGLDRPEEVTAEALRYAYLDFLLRQGIRAADVGRIVGRVPQRELVSHMQLHSPAARLPIEQIERLLPALRELAATGIG